MSPTNFQCDIHIRRYSGTFARNSVAIKEIDRRSWEAKTKSEAEWTLGQSTIAGLADNELLKEARILSKLRHPNICFFFGLAVKYADSGSDEVHASEGAGGAASAIGGSQRAAHYAHNTDSNIQSYFLVTELCDTSMDKLMHMMGFDHTGVDNCELWEMLVQVAAGMQVKQ